MGKFYLSRNAIRFTEDGSEERAFSTTDGTDNGGQATLLDGHVDIVYECLGFLGILIISRNVVLLGPLERSTGDTDGICVDRVGIRGNWDSLGSNQEGIDTAPGSSSDGTCTEGWIEDAVLKTKTVCNIPEELGKSD